jgi:xanthine dehydrogenase small subunit
MRDHIRFIFRGKPIELADFSPTRSVLDWLREDKRAVGTKEGCNEGDCGACTAVLVRWEGSRGFVFRPINTCITLLGMLDGAVLFTIEDLAEGGKLHPIQQAMVDHHGSQCGFCTPGIVMSLYAMSKSEGPITRATVNDQLAGNLCRCTGYRPIVDAALAALPVGDHVTSPHEFEAPELVAQMMSDGDAIVRWEDGFFAAPRQFTTMMTLAAEHPDATIVAGATDVGLWITKQFRPIRKVIWIGNVEDFDVIIDAGDLLIFSAGASHEKSLPYLAAISSDLGELGRRFGSKQVRAQGTVGGNIANGSPIGDWAPAFIALGTDVQLQMRGASGKVEMRRMALEDFFIGYGKQDRRPGELLTTIWVPKPQPDEHFRCFKISKRFDEDISALMGAFKLTVVKGKVTAARIAFGGMAATPKRAPKAEAALVGAKLADRATWDVAIAALAEDYQPIGDMRASARYRMETAQALLRKALIEIGGGAGTRLHEPPQMAAE